MRAEERLKAEGRLVDGEAAPGDILAQVRMCVCSFCTDTRALVCEFEFSSIVLP